MEYIYATLTLNELGEELNEANITRVLEAAGADVIESRVKAIVAALEDVDIDQLGLEAGIPPAPKPDEAAPETADAETDADDTESSDVDAVRTTDADSDDTDSDDTDSDVDTDADAPAIAPGVDDEMFESPSTAADAEDAPEDR